MAGFFTVLTFERYQSFHKYNYTNCVYENITFSSLIDLGHESKSTMSDYLLLLSGIVLLVNGIGDYLKNHTTLNVQHYWVYTLLLNNGSKDYFAGNSFTRH